MAPLGILTLRWPSGLVTNGAPVPHVLAQLDAGDGFYRGILSWADLTNEDPVVRASEIIDECRRSFRWQELAALASRTLARSGFSYAAAIDAGRELLEFALADDWPVCIEQSAALIRASRATATPAAAATEQGLLWLLSESLVEQWSDPVGALRSDAAMTRFSRLAMLASSLGANGQTVPRVIPPATRAPSAALPTTTALLGTGRLVERDSAIRWLVRAIELYDELLKVSNDARSAFLAHKGVPLRTWIVKVCSIASLVEQQASVRLDLRSPPDSQPARDVMSVVRALSRTAPEHSARLVECRRTAADPFLAFQSLRERPLLDLGDDQFLVLHKDFFLASADDGVWYALAGIVGSSFGSLFGEALEAYVGRVLARIADAAPGVLARIPPEQEVQRELRCDFALRFGDDLILVDSKRAGLNSAHLMGDARAPARLHEDLGKGCNQLLSTKRAFDDGRLRPTLEALGVPSSWRPRRCLPLLVTHRPVFVVFSSADDLLSVAGLRDQWVQRFQAAPCVWSLSDLELIEAALPTISGPRLIRDAEAGLPIINAGVPSYLSYAGYTGPIASAYYDRRRHEILTPYTQALGQSP